MRPEVARRTAGKTTRLRRLVQLWTLILIITGLFQLFRGAPVDAAFFLCGAAILVLDAAGLVRFTGPARPRVAWLLLAALPLGILLLLAPRHGVMEGIIVSAIGASVLMFCWSPTSGPAAVLSRAAETGSDEASGDPAGRDRPRAMSPAVRRAAILWSVVGVVCCLWEVASFLLGLPSPEAAIEHPSISALLDPILDTIEGRIVFTALWLLAGAALLRNRGFGRRSS